MSSPDVETAPAPSAHIFINRMRVIVLHALEGDQKVEATGKGAQPKIATTAQHESDTS